MSDVEYQKYLDKTLRFLSYRPRSEKEVKDNLIKKKAPQEIIDQIITWLKEQRFLNDEEFARWWIEQRSQFRPRGMRIIQIELKQKGISREIIDEVMQNSEVRVQNEFESAKKLVEKKLPKYKGLDKYEIYRKLGAHLARRGFDWDMSKKVIDSVLSPDSDS